MKHNERVKISSNYVFFYDISQGGHRRYHRDTITESSYVRLCLVLHGIPFYLYNDSIIYGIDLMEHPYAIQ